VLSTNIEEKQLDMKGNMIANELTKYIEELGGGKYSTVERVEVYRRLLSIRKRGKERND